MSVYVNFYIRKKDTTLAVIDRAFPKIASEGRYI